MSWPVSSSRGQQGQRGPADQRGVAEPRLAGRCRQAQEFLELGAERGVGQLQAVVRRQQPDLEQDLGVGGTFGQFRHFGGDPQPFGRGVGGPDRVVLSQQAGGQRQRIAARPGGRHCLRRERPGTRQIEPVPGQGPGQARHHTQPQRVVVLAGAECVEGLGEQRDDLGRGPPDAGADGVQAERGPGELGRVPVGPGSFRGAQVGLAGGLALAGPPPRLSQLEQCPGATGGPGVRGGDRVLPVPRRFLVRQPGGGLAGRSHAVLPGWRRSRVGEHEVPGQFGQRDVAARRPAGLEGMADLPVQAGPSGCGAAARRRTRGTGRARSGRRPGRPGSPRGPGPRRRPPRSRTRAAGGSPGRRGPRRTAGR